MRCVKCETIRFDSDYIEAPTDAITIRGGDALCADHFEAGVTTDRTIEKIKLASLARNHLRDEGFFMHYNEDPDEVQAAFAAYQKIVDSDDFSYACDTHGNRLPYQPRRYVWTDAKRWRRIPE